MSQKILAKVLVTLITAVLNMCLYTLFLSCAVFVIACGVMHFKNRFAFGQRVFPKLTHRGFQTAVTATLAPSCFFCESWPPESLFSSITVTRNIFMYLYLIVSD